MYGCALLMLALCSALTLPAEGGICWSSVGRGGKCTEIMAEKVSREDCCSSSMPAVAWSEEDLDSGTLFFWRILGGGVLCQSCRETCEGYKCGSGRRCVVRRGRPRCACAPACGRHTAGKSPGPVCGTDGRTYRTLCKLRRRACKRRAVALQVAYYGNCQSSCDRIRCPSGKHCVVDQNLSPHCVRCSRTCPDPEPTLDGVEVEDRRVCGADGNTYPSSCHLRESACTQGKGVPMAYPGKCREDARCGSVSCSARQSCLTTADGGARCVTCGRRCARGGHVGGGAGGPKAICATNNRTYSSWCHMLQDACATGYVIDTKHSGPCNAEADVSVNSVSEESGEDFLT